MCPTRSTAKRKSASTWLSTPSICWLIPLDDFDDPIDGCQEPVGVSLLLERGKELVVQNAAGERIGQNRFQTVPDFNSRLAVANRNEEQHAILLVLLSNAPLLEELYG